MQNWYAISNLVPEGRLSPKMGQENGSFVRQVDRLSWVETGFKPNCPRLSCAGTGVRQVASWVQVRLRYAQMSEAEIMAIESWTAKCAELTEERDWLARQYQKATGSVYVPGKLLRMDSDGGPMPKLNPFTAQIPKPASRGTITLTGPEYDALVRKVRCRALEDAWEIVTSSETFEGDGDLDHAAKTIRALIEREKKP